MTLKNTIIASIVRVEGQMDTLTTAANQMMALRAHSWDEETHYRIEKNYADAARKIYDMIERLSRAWAHKCHGCYMNCDECGSTAIAAGRAMLALLGAMEHFVSWVSDNILNITPEQAQAAALDNAMTGMLGKSWKN